MPSSPPIPGDVEIRRAALNPAEAAVVLGVSRQPVYALIGRGELRRFKVGRCARIPTADVLGLVGGDGGPNAAA